LELIQIIFAALTTTQPTLMKNSYTILFSAILLSFALVSKAQTFSLVPGEFITEHITLEYFNNVQVDMHHPDYDEMTFGWITIDVDFPKEWTYESCDNGGCYGQLPDSAMVGPLPDTVPGYIRITINPWKTEGVGMVKLYIYNTKFPDEGKMVDFEIIATELTSVNEHATLPIEIFPNPATHYLTLQNPSAKAKNFEIMDMTGKVFQSGLLPDGQGRTIQLFNYPKGIYFVRYGQNNHYQTKKIIVQ